MPNRSTYPFSGSVRNRPCRSRHAANEIEMSEYLIRDLAERPTPNVNIPNRQAAKAGPERSNIASIGPKKATAGTTIVTARSTVATTAEMLVRGLIAVEMSESAFLVEDASAASERAASGSNRRARRALTYSQQG